jgi:hypothetical protein
MARWGERCTGGLLNDRAFQERLQLAAAGRMPQLPQRFRFDLPDPLAGDREVLADGQEFPQVHVPATLPALKPGRAVTFPSNRASASTIG